jgi:hypothetical protein
MKLGQRIFDFVIVTAAASAVVAAWVWLAYIPFGDIPPKLINLAPGQQPTTLSQLGTYGDMFGALTCLFTGLGFVGAGYAVILQLRALRHQQDEMERATREHAASERARQKELKAAAAWQRRVALMQATSFLVQAQTARLDFLKMVDMNQIEPAKRPEFYDEYKEVVADTREKTKLLSAFVLALANEHSGDVNDPSGFLTLFGLGPEEPDTP